MVDSQAHPSGCYRFAGCTFDPRARTLMRDGKRIALPPKSLECLAYLIEHRDRAVGRDELIAAVWGRADVGYPVLAQTLWKARRALGAAQADADLVRTVSRFGYQWVAPLERVDAASGSVEERPAEERPVEATSAATASRGGRSSRRWIGIALAFAAAVIGAAVVVSWRRPSAPPPAADAAPAQNPRFLVLPVALASDGSDTAWMRLGVMDYLVARLRESGDAAVMPSDRVLALLGQNPHFDAGDPAQLNQLRLVSGASYVIAPRAERVQGRWQLRFVVHASDAVESVEASAANPLEASNDAVGALLRIAGMQAKPLQLAVDPLTELLQRIDAASLAGDQAHALELARGAPPALQQDERLLAKTSQIAFRSGRLDEAAAGFERLANSAQGTSARVAAKMGLASIAERRQRYADAVAGYGGALDLLGASGDPALAGQAYMMRGLAEGYLGQVDASLADLGRARVKLARGGDPTMLAALDTALGLAERARGRYGDAAAAFERAIDVLERFGMNDRLASALIGATGARLAMLDLPRALTLGERGWTLAGKLDSRILVNYLAVVYGNALLANGRLRDAEALLRQLGAAADAGSAEAVPDLLLLQVDVRSAAGRRGVAADRVDALLQRIEHPAEPTYRTSFGGAALIVAADAARANDVAVLDRLLQRLRSDAGADGLRTLALELIQAEAAAMRKDPAAAAHFKAALAEVDRNAYPDALVAVGVAWARHLDADSDRETVTMLAGRLAPFVERDFRAARAAAKLYRLLGEHELAAAAAAAAAALGAERDPYGAL